ncbi:MAG: glycoside hydrolase family 99-like domain-containing protein, partial [Thermoplasmata archaeon]
PLYHFIVAGWKEKRNPNEFFDIEFYLKTYPDIEKAKVNPLFHYHIAGWKEGRNPSESFDTIMYLLANKDVDEAGVNPLSHYLLYGKKEGRMLYPFEPQAFAQQYFLQERFNNPKISENFCPDTNIDLKNETLPVKLIALYLPQFHPIPENDKWWGKGFTEWYNVTKAQPKFVGHYQPHLPVHMGFYDLRLLENIKIQAELARKYGIHGFCLYYYYFGDKTLLDKPLELIYQNKDIDINYCVYWANENWTRRWDGLEREVLIEQKHTIETDKAFIERVIKYLQDDRYIKINGRPILIVYRIDKLANPSETVEYWKEYCIKNGLKEPYLIAVSSFGFFDDPKKYGFDAIMEYLHMWHGAPQSIKRSIRLMDHKFRGQIYSYFDLVKMKMEHIDNLDKTGYNIYHTVVPCWDNTARRPYESVVFHGSDPYLYKKWLEKAIENTIKYKTSEERIVFVDAWNEWAEGNHLEPDRRFGYAYLQATAEALIHFMSETQKLKYDNQIFYSPRKTEKRIFYKEINLDSIIKTADVSVVIHLYYKELWEEFKSYMVKLTFPFDLYISIPTDVFFDYSEVFSFKPNSYIFRSVNRGRDIYPSLQIMKAIYDKNYKYVIKFHSKKSLHRWDGDKWRISSLNCIFSNPTEILNFLEKNKDIGIVVPHKQWVSTKYHMGSNVKWLKWLCERYEVTWNGEDFFFPAGSFYWIRPESIKELLKNPPELENFELELFQSDGCLHHGIERFVGLLAQKNGYKVVEVDEYGNIKPAEGTYFHEFATPEERRDSGV